ncbi:3387_t:CDS:1, partial [Funneliformis geosporum]
EDNMAEMDAVIESNEDIDDQEFSEERKYKLSKHHKWYNDIFELVNQRSHY